jgi:SAM-dependent methyltransferase
MPSASNRAHRGLPFANPMSEAAVDRVLDALRLPPGALVIDTGCGSGEMLLRALERDPTWRGLGVDLDADAIAAARAGAAERLPGRDVRFEVRDAGEVSGRHDAVLNVGSSHVHGGYPAALGALRELVGDGGAVVYGEGYWREEPSPAFLDALGGANEDELDTFGGLRSAAVTAGFEIGAVAEASEEDWARYEETLAANAEREGDPDALEYARRIRERRALPGGGSTLGFALLLLRAV